MIIKVLKSKNDQLRKGVEVVILQSSSSVCLSIMGNDAVVYKWKYKYISGSAVKV